MIFDFAGSTKAVCTEYALQGVEFWHRSLMKSLFCTRFFMFNNNLLCTCRNYVCIGLCGASDQERERMHVYAKKFRFEVTDHMFAITEQVPQQLDYLLIGHTSY